MWLMFREQFKLINIMEIRFVRRDVSKTEFPLIPAVGLSYTNHIPLNLITLQR